MLTSKWADKGLDKEINEFLSMWTGASKTKVEDQVNIKIVKIKY